MHQRQVKHHHGQAEDGYILLFAIFLLALLTIALSLAMPVIIKQLQLDRERETMERGKQYRRAVQLYYKKFRAYPPSVDALVETNNIRFLRKKYIDPMTGKDDWHPILFGQNKTPTAMGFFGQPLAGVGPTGGSTLAGTGPSGGNSSGGSLPGGISDILGGGPTSGGASTSSPSSGGPGSTPSGGLGSSPGGPGTTGNGGMDPSAPGAGGMGGNGQTFGGAGIVGFSPGSTKQSIMIYKKKDRFNEWEFTYDPLSDQQMGQGNGQAFPVPGAGVVGNGSGPGGTGPVTSPSQGTQQTTGSSTQ